MDRIRRKLLMTGAAALGGRMLSRSLGLPLAIPWASRTVAASSRAPGLPERIRFDPGPFPLGVASGDPTPEAVVIWTRLAPDPLTPQGGLTNKTPVWWGVARDPDFKDLVDLGAVVARPEEAGAVHVDVTGLEPDTEYFYTFWNAEQVTSAVGRTRTAPSGPVNSLRFVFASCQRIDHGRYGAFARMVEEDPAFILHLGDYIYESPLEGDWPSGVRGEAADLESYRARYALYKGDSQLRAAHQAAPWIMAWDDHEVVNNYWREGPEQDFLQRRAEAYRAWYEHMPVRSPAGPPEGSDFHIHRQLVFGDLLDLLVLDTRQFRDRATSGQDLDDPDRTLLGDEQKQWLKDRLDDSAASWRCLGNQVLMADARMDGLSLNNDAWQGYGAERAEILGHIADHDIGDIVVLSGDAHQSMVSELKIDFDDPSAPNVATEFLVTSVTSGGVAPRPGTVTARARNTFYPENRHLRYLESELRGYAVCEVSKAKWTTTLRTVDPSDPNAPAETLAAFEVSRGAPEINQVSGGSGNPTAGAAVTGPDDGES